MVLHSSSARRCLVDKARALQRNVSRIDRRTAERMFPEAQRRQWPTGYLPASGVAHLLQPDGVPFGDVLECYQDMRQQGRRSEVQSDFASDYTMWTRFALDDATRRFNDREKRRFKKITARDRAAHDHEIRELFHLAPYAPPPPVSPPASALHTPPRPPPPGQANSAVDSKRTLSASSGAAGSDPARFYQFTPYASTQQYAMLPVDGVQSPRQRVHFSTFPQLRNVVHTDFDSMGSMRGLSLYTGDELLWSAEAVQALAFYLKRRLEHYEAAEATFLASASHLPPPPSSSSKMSLLAPGEAPTFSRESPILCLFGNGRLPFLLQATRIVPKLIRPVQLPSQEARRARQYKQLLHQRNSDTLFHAAFRTIFPCETLSVGDALRTYRPAIVIVEPHIDRDWFCDVRGFFSVREVLALGPVDSPAMGSFAYPFLSFGVTPGPNTYWAYNDNLHRVHASERIQMPVDPPYEAQGYAKDYVDDLSAWLISANDCPAVKNQARAVRFVRQVCPVIRPRTAAATSTTAT